MQERRLSCVGKEELTYGPLRLSLHGKMPPAARHAAHWRQVEGADPLRGVQCRLHPLQRPAGKAGRGEQHGAVVGSEELERDGLIQRQEFLEVPVRVEYRPTERCRTLLPILEALSDWAEADMK